VKRYKHILTGLTFILALALFIYGYNFLKGKNIFNKQTFFYAKYEEVSGLEVANPVLINGYRVGQVNELYFDPAMSGDIIVVLMIDKQFPVPKDTYARIISADIMGSKAVDLDLGKSIELAANGDTLGTSLEASLRDEVNKQVQPIKMKAENLLSSIDSLVVAIQTIFNESAVENLTESFNDIRLTFANLQSTTSNIDTLVDQEGNRISSILENIDSLTFTLRNNRENISAILNNFETISDSLAKSDIPGTFIRANRSLDKLELILTQIESGEGSLGMLLHNDTLYMEVTKSAEELNKLLEDIRLNPKRYVKFSVF
jgi:phospholipid/cholesterol/gamma-HCH transport system substrate-binding protein